MKDGLLTQYRTVDKRTLHTSDDASEFGFPSAAEVDAFCGPEQIPSDADPFCGDTSEDEDTKPASDDHVPAEEKGDKTLTPQKKTHQESKEEAKDIDAASAVDSAASLVAATAIIAVSDDPDGYAVITAEGHADVEPSPGILSPKRELKKASSPKTSPLPKSPSRRRKSSSSTKTSAVPVTTPLKVQVTLGPPDKPPPLSDQENICLLPEDEEEEAMDDVVLVPAPSSSQELAVKSPAKKRHSSTLSSPRKSPALSPTSATAAGKSPRARRQSTNLNAAAALSIVPTVVSPSRHSVRLTLHPENADEHRADAEDAKLKGKVAPSPASAARCEKMRELAAPSAWDTRQEPATSLSSSPPSAKPASGLSTSSSSPKVHLPSSPSPQITEDSKNSLAVASSRGGAVSEAASVTSPKVSPTTGEDQAQPKEEAEVPLPPPRLASADADLPPIERVKSVGLDATSRTKLGLKCRVQLVPADLDTARNHRIILNQALVDKISGKTHSSKKAAKADDDDRTGSKRTTTKIVSEGKSKMTCKSKTKTISASKSASLSRASSSDDEYDGEGEGSDSSTSSSSSSGSSGSDSDEEVAAKRPPSLRKMRVTAKPANASSDEEEEVEEEAPKKKVGPSKRAAFLQDLKAEKSNKSQTERGKKTLLKKPKGAVKDKEKDDDDDNDAVAGKWRQKRRVIEDDDDDDDDDDEDWEMDDDVGKEAKKKTMKDRLKNSASVVKRHSLRRSASRSPSPMVRSDSSKATRTPLALKVSNAQAHAEGKKAERMVDRLESVNSASSTQNSQVGTKQALCRWVCTKMIIQSDRCQSSYCL